MASLLKIIAVGIIGVMLGLLLTIRSLDPETRGIVAGAWRGATRDGSPDVDPYSLAAVDRSGLLPLGAAEGLRFVAETDSAGGVLAGSCDYVVTGPMPVTRYWTLSLVTPDGFPIANPANRYGFTSVEVLRQKDEPVAIDIARTARSGNWLPLGQTTRFVLALHLYDTGLSAVGSTFETTAMPTIRKLGCRP